MFFNIQRPDRNNLPIWFAIIPLVVLIGGIIIGVILPMMFPPGSTADYVAALYEWSLNPNEEAGITPPDDLSTHIYILLAIGTAILLAVISRYKWSEIAEGIQKGISYSAQALIILVLIGTIIPAWTLGGIIPSLVVYGMEILNPQFFLITVCLSCSVVSVAIGSSWTTAATIGIASMSVGEAFGLPMEIVAAAVVCGSFFGDKMSPFSDTTNLASGVLKVELTTHIRHMMWTTVPSYVLTLIMFLILGFTFEQQPGQAALVEEKIQAFKEYYLITPWLLLPVLIIFIMILFKMPAIPGLMISTIIGCLLAVIIQGFDGIAIAKSLFYGYQPQDTFPDYYVEKISTKGGITDMAFTISLTLCATSFGGIMERTGFLNVILQFFLRGVKRVGGLIVATVISSVTANITTGDQYLAIILPGRMYEHAYRKKNLAIKNLSRTLEDAGTLTAPLILWSGSGAFLTGLFSTSWNVTVWDFAPWSVFCYATLVFAIIYGYLRFKVPDAEEDQD